MSLLVLNAGSATVKFRLFATPDLTVLADGMAERLGSEAARLRVHTPAEDSVALPGATAATAIRQILQHLSQHADLHDLVAVGHRVVHGGTRFTAPTPVTAAILPDLASLNPLAPLHNPANLAGIEAALDALPGVPQVACFDTAFFAELPPEAWHYPIPADWVERYGLRRYGFHGYSHRYVSQQAAIRLNRPLHGLKLITLHLGSGCSATAIDRGRPIDTTMGFSTLPGLVMRTRSGDIDPGIVFHLLRQGLAWDAVERSLYQDSGLKGVAGGPSDHRELRALSAQGDAPAQLALAVELRQLIKTVGAYWALLGGADAIVCTGGIGEHDAATRAGLFGALACLGLQVDGDANSGNTPAFSIHAPDSAAALWVIATDEEWQIAVDVQRHLLDPTA